MIHAARKQRQQARELGGLADYIKVDDANYPSKDSQTSSTVSARLVREDELDKSDEEENEDGRVDFTVDLEKKTKQQRREAFFAAENSGMIFGRNNSLFFPLIFLTRNLRYKDDHAETSEEDDWERQQFQKALRHRPLENAYKEMSLQNKYIEDKRSPVREPRLPARSTRDRNAAPDLTKLAPLPDPKNIQEKLRER